MASSQAVSELRVGSRESRRHIGESPARISTLIAAFASNYGSVRETARQRLVDIGRPAVVPLTEALASGDIQTRWEAAKALGEIADPAAAPALACALHDDEFGIRWLAAEGLILIGPEALQPLLQALIENSGSPLLRQGAHHVLRALSISRGSLKRTLQPVLVALDGPEPALEVPLAAGNTLDALQVAPKRQGTRRGESRPSVQRSGTPDKKTWS